jgi:hypothetical protein
MKKFMEITVQLKFVWSIFFAGALLLYASIGMMLGNSSMELIVVWQIVALTLVLTFFHYLFFGELILNSLAMKYKVIIHSILCYITMLILFIVFNWTFISKLKDLIIFTGSYIVLYLSCVLSFYIYYKATGEELNNRLTAYKQNKDAKYEGESK